MRSAPIPFLLCAAALAGCPSGETPEPEPLATSDISIRVQQSRSELPLRNVLVTVDSETIATDDGGRATFTLLQGLSYEVRVDSAVSRTWSRLAAGAVDREEIVLHGLSDTNSAPIVLVDLMRVPRSVDLVGTEVTIDREATHSDVLFEHPERAMHMFGGVEPGELTASVVPPEGVTCDLSGTQDGRPTAVRVEEGALSYLPVWCR